MTSYLKEGLALSAFVDDGLRIGSVFAVGRIHLELRNLQPWKHGIS